MDFFNGQCLLAMPGMRDERFERAVIYVCSHTAEGAMGLVVNKPLQHLTFDDLLAQLHIVRPEKGVNPSVMAVPLTSCAVSFCIPPNTRARRP